MIDAYITNLGKYNEGELVGEWVTFPTDSDTLAETFEKIGIGSEYEEFFVTDYDVEATTALYSILGEYPSLEELNYLAVTLDNLSQDDLEKFDACIGCGIVSVSSLKDAINLAENMDCYALYSDIEDKYDLGYYYAQEAGIYDIDSMGTLANYIDYEAFGRDISYQQTGEFTSLGYIEEVDRMTLYYSGIDDIPDKDRLFSYVDHKSIEFLKNTELGTEENYNNIDGVRNNIAPDKDESKGKPSLLGALKESKETVKEATAKAEKEVRPPAKDEDCR